MTLDVWKPVIFLAYWSQAIEMIRVASYDWVEQDLLVNKRQIALEYSNTSIAASIRTYITTSKTISANTFVWCIYCYKWNALNCSCFFRILFWAISARDKNRIWWFNRCLTTNFWEHNFNFCHFSKSETIQHFLDRMLKITLCIKPYYGYRNKMRPSGRAVGKAVRSYVAGCGFHPGILLKH